MNKLDRLIQASSQRLSERINSGADRAQVALKVEAEHKRRSAGQKHRQLCARVWKAFQVRNG